jgi:hypothetical protein
MQLTQALRHKFIQRFYYHVGESLDMVQAYERTEDEFVEQYGHRMYNGYDVFKTVKCRILKIKRKEKHN